jgi:hypothetical protein
MNERNGFVAIWLVSARDVRTLSELSVEMLCKSGEHQLRNQEVFCGKRKQVENAVARFIDGFCIPVRRHSSLGFQSPIAFDRKAREVS